MISRAVDFAALEKSFGARLGVWALDTGQRLAVQYRADERFAFCSTVKAFLAAAVVQNRSLTELDQTIHYTHAEVIDNSPITQKHVATGMTLREICDAAIRYSDNTAANLLFNDIGGPAAAQRFIRSLGDTTSNISRSEPDLNTAVPGDLRDTTTPRAWANDLQEVTLGNSIPTEKQAILTNWLINNTTGEGLIRSAIPAGWKVGDKTGAGYYGTRNDIAVIWPPHRKPIILAIMTSRPDKDASSTDNNPLIAQATKATLNALQ